MTGAPRPSRSPRSIEGRSGTPPRAPGRPPRGRPCSRRPNAAGRRGPTSLPGSLPVPRRSPGSRGRSLRSRTRGGSLRGRRRRGRTGRPRTATWRQRGATSDDPRARAGTDPAPRALRGRTHWGTTSASRPQTLRERRLLSVALGSASGGRTREVRFHDQPLRARVLRVAGREDERGPPGLLQDDAGGCLGQDEVPRDGVRIGAEPGE